MRNVVTGVLNLILYLVAAAGGALGVSLIYDRRSALYEIEGLICILIGVVALGAATIVSTLEKIHQQRR